jgi:hypothetical protein
MPVFAMAPRPPTRDKEATAGGFVGAPRPPGTGRPHRASSRSARAAMIASQVSEEGKS